ncbi:MAG TPA: cell division protein FtsZ [Fervidobacterium sp.]|jgi:cell division protein FtsZ|nr:cell division protein FtsZ [Fervidobacterium sp.]NLH38095.1 cell division protein FtsZ [Thermotogaceae bacterium]HOK34044.1 cell division protein FtsZ [Fervidobacterium sp.]HOL03021.1 cell division protein FtsZ [Fervidobacterium sp.]HON04022.1 cell division protein FtsZ [Fervidobacterium sp.]
MPFMIEKESKQVSSERIPGVPILKVIGVGGAGCNAINRMAEVGIKGVTLISVNTDAQVLEVSKADIVVQIGEKLTKGLGAGGNAKVGEEAALEDRKKLEDILHGTDMLFITAGFGGGTGTGAAPVIAEIAKTLGILTVAIVTMPFFFEGTPRWNTAREGIAKMAGKVDTLIKISNNKLLEELSPSTTIVDAFSTADEILHQGVKGISDLIMKRGYINLDFADIESVMRNAGNAMLGIGIGKGEKRVYDATRKALDNKFLDYPIENAKSLILNISAPRNSTLQEMQEAAMIVKQTCSEDADMKFGMVIDDELSDDEMRVTVIATKFDTEDNSEKQAEDIPAIYKFGLEYKGNVGE